ncbi:MAG: efflux RND transporter periplasmic adaptor subunit [Tenuifilaceae bacterium]|jgi:hypothetical protein|nr:efflux RND transporter periplasmic adaptor subunit [Tenuifilaceae bacterium]
MKKKIAIGSAIVIVVIIIVVIFGSKGSKTTRPQITSVLRGDFEIMVPVTGELQAQSSELITGPDGLRGRSIRFSEIKIQDLIPEGTVVDSGDYVATLDRSALSNRVKEIDDELEKSQQQYIKTQLDTTLQLRSLRDNLINLKFDMEEKKIVLEQSIYEPPATQRQAQINLEKAERAYNQEQHNYKIKKEQAEASMKEVAINLARKEREKQDMLSVLSQFEVRAPKSGMVIYYREWGGQKRKVGSSISPWDLNVATLPDLSAMISKTYVNEIDVSKVKKGQKVRIGVDAFPDKKYTGNVTDVANIGEQLPSTDAKVFEVLIRVNEHDDILRPSMTTSNQILINRYDNVLYIPLESLHTADSITFVYTEKGNKRVVLSGDMNENYIIIEKGLNEGDKIYLSIPEDADDFKLSGGELINEVKQRVRQKYQVDSTVVEQDVAVKDENQRRREN